MTSAGGHNNSGSVYQLSPTTGYHLLYAFSLNGPGGKNPQGNLAMDSAGNLFGTTVHGGIGRPYCQTLSCGVVFELSPPSNGVGPWTETVLYSFCQKANCADGANPEAGVVFDSAGNLYGTTLFGGSGQAVGTVFELSPTFGSWTEKVLHSFGNTAGDGADPQGALILDADRNLYGTTTDGGQDSSGTVFELSPSGSGWTETVLYAFGFSGSGDGSAPVGGLAFDALGNLYGVTEGGGNSSCDIGCGTVFELSQDPDGSWAEAIIHSFAGGTRDGVSPQAGVVLDSSGNVYGTTEGGGIQSCPPAAGCGTAFKLSPSAGQWSETLLRFPGQSYGSNPIAPLILDSAGNIYGTATSKGRYGDGVVFMITQ